VLRRVQLPPCTRFRPYPRARPATGAGCTCCARRSAQAGEILTGTHWFVLVVVCDCPSAPVRVLTPVPDLPLARGNLAVRALMQIARRTRRSAGMRDAGTMCLYLRVLLFVRLICVLLSVSSYLCVLICVFLSVCTYLCLLICVYLSVYSYLCILIWLSRWNG
jgi:hypothetical protein